MRSSLLFRVLVVVGLAAIIGVPGLEQFEPTPVEAQTSVYRMPPSDVWTGVMAEPNQLKAADGDSGGPTAPLIVRFRESSSRATQVNAHVQAGATRADAIALANTVRVEVPAGQVDSALAAYNAQPNVLYAEPDYVARALYTPNDPLFSSQWGLQKVGAPAAWDVTRGAAAVKVAVVDCGIFDEATGRRAGDGQPGHPDLRGRVVANQDFTSSSTGFDDYCNHGTHVAGIIAANEKNSIGVTGLAPNIALMNAKVLGDSGSGSTSNIVNGVIWAVQNGAKVVNLSLGRDGACSQTEREAYTYAWSQGVVVVAAAGNSGQAASGAPANCDNVISVASTTSADQRSSFSNYGTRVDVAAPGSGIVSTVRTGEYASFSGTSMASPHVAALAALIWSQGTATTAQAVVDRIRSTADQIPGTGSAWAWGRINAAAALGGGGPIPPTPTATPTNTPTPVVGSPPTRTTCPSPRPPVQITSSPASQTTVNVSVRAGAGVVRELAFRELRNAAVTIGDHADVTSPFTFTPAGFGATQQFRVTRPDPAHAWTINLAISDDCGAWTTFVGGGANSGPHGSVSGVVKSATTNQPLAGAAVTARETQRTGVTGAGGTFTIADLPVGTVNLDVALDGYASQTTQATVQQGQTTSVTVSLAPVTTNLPDITVSLTWGRVPADLDAHMSGPGPNGGRFHLYWNNPTAVRYAVLGDDDDDGFGPETITIKKNPATGTWVPGDYRFWAHNYSGSPEFDSSRARVTVTRGSQTLGTYDVSDADGNASQPLWRAVALTIDANGGVTLAPIQRFSAGGSSTTLSVPDGQSGTIEWPAVRKP